MYLENVTCTENLEDAVELSSDQLRAIVTLQSPVNCEYFIWFIHELCIVAFIYMLAVTNALFVLSL